MTFHHVTLLLNAVYAMTLLSAVSVSVCLSVILCMAVAINTSVYPHVILVSYHALAVIVLYIIIKKHKIFIIKFLSASINLIVYRCVALSADFLCIFLCV